MEEQTIRLSSSGIGVVRLDPVEIRGEGSRYNPRLVIPLKISLYPQPIEHQIIILRLTASLHLDQGTYQGNQFGLRITYDPIVNMPIRSLTGVSSDDSLELHFNLTQEQIKLLEDIRHKSGKNLYLQLEPIVVWNKHTINSVDEIQGQRVSTLGENGWATHVGMISDFAFFWQPTVGMLRLDLAKMNWSEGILPGLGYDTYRLIEVSLPTSDVLVPPEAIQYFNSAKKHYDVGNHEVCLRECRLALEEIEKYLKVQSHELGTAISKKLEWPTQPKLTDQADFLNHAWLSVYILANAASHAPSTKGLKPADAHTGLLSLALLLEYLGQIR